MTIPRNPSEHGDENLDLPELVTEVARGIGILFPESVEIIRNALQAKLSPDAYGHNEDQRLLAQVDDNLRGKLSAVLLNGGRNLLIAELRHPFEINDQESSAAGSSAIDLGLNTSRFQTQEALGDSVHTGAEIVKAAAEKLARKIVQDWPEKIQPTLDALRRGFQPQSHGSPEEQLLWQIDQDEFGELSRLLGWTGGRDAFTEALEDVSAPREEVAGESEEAPAHESRRRPRNETEETIDPADPNAKLLRRALKQNARLREQMERNQQAQSQLVQNILAAQNLTTTQVQQALERLDRENERMRETIQHNAEAQHGHPGAEEGHADEHNTEHDDTFHAAPEGWIANAKHWIDSHVPKWLQGTIKEILRFYIWGTYTAAGRLIKDGAQFVPKKAAAHGHADHAHPAPAADHAQPAAGADHAHPHPEPAAHGHAQPAGHAHAAEPTRRQFLKGTVPDVARVVAAGAAVYAVPKIAPNVWHAKLTAWLTRTGYWLARGMPSENQDVLKDLESLLSDLGETKQFESKDKNSKKASVMTSNYSAESIPLNESEILEFLRGRVSDYQTLATIVERAASQHGAVHVIVQGAQANLSDPVESNIVNQTRTQARNPQHIAGSIARVPALRQKLDLVTAGNMLADEKRVDFKKFERITISFVNTPEEVTAAAANTHFGFPVIATSPNSFEPKDADKNPNGDLPQRVAATGTGVVTVKRK